MKATLSYRHLQYGDLKEKVMDFSTYINHQLPVLGRGETPWREDVWS